jgi:hypothetical protein
MFEINGKGRNTLRDRQSLDSQCLPSQTNSLRSAKDGSFADTVRASIMRRGYQDFFLPEKFGLLQFRRRGYSDSRQFLPLRISIPPTSTLCDIEGRFENPRKAPLPQGLKYNTTTVPQKSFPDTPPSAICTILQVLF